MSLSFYLTDALFDKKSILKLCVFVKLQKYVHLFYTVPIASTLNSWIVKYAIKPVHMDWNHTNTQSIQTFYFDQGTICFFGLKQC